LNNLEFDHADIFRDLADVQRTFSHLTRIVPRNGWIVLNGDDENLRALGPLAWTRVVRVGVGASNNVRIEKFSEDASGARFTLTWVGKKWGDVSWASPGIFNARNAAMAAVAVALATGGAPESGAVPVISLAPLARFRGVKRRQEILVAMSKLTVIEDFGHHPTALAETLISLANRYPGALLTAVFEPRSNTARTKTLQAGFMRALEHADEVFLGAVNRADKLAESERFDSESVVHHLETKGVRAVTAATNTDLLARLREATLVSEGALAVESRVVVFFSNGNFDGIIAAYATAAKTG
jgi:UDP-N-acetylmuramate: L-alanyl-gamma-D-glutamyl-meso-diaminopimelate ligase